MDQIDTVRVIAEFLANSAGLPTLDPQADLIALGIIDSLTMMDLLVFVESRFGVRIDFHDLTPTTFESVARFAQVVEGYRLQKNGCCRAA